MKIARVIVARDVVPGDLVAGQGLAAPEQGPVGIQRGVVHVAELHEVVAASFDEHYNLDGLWLSDESLPGRPDVMLRPNELVVVWR